MEFTCEGSALDHRSIEVHLASLDMKRKDEIAEPEKTHHNLGTSLARES